MDGRYVLRIDEPLVVFIDAHNDEEAKEQAQEERK